MADGIFAAMSGATTQQLLLDIVANNLANVNTAGYKEDRPRFGDFIAPLLRGQRDSVQRLDKRYAVLAGTYTDYDQGAIRPTSNPLDIALTGDGFLAVESARGTRYTRQGTLTINGAGELATRAGLRVLDDKGKPIVVARKPEPREPATPPKKPGDLAKKPPEPREVEIRLDSSGQVYVEQKPVARLGLFKFTPGQLGKEGDALFVASGPATADPDTSVHQGYLESSNVNAVATMVDLIRVSRGIEMATAAIRAHREMDRQSTTQVGRL